jgi:asparagine synthase (glutamine-hydrolysing)
VECRLDRDHPVAVSLSGGLDSSSVAAIASLCLQKRNRQLTAIAGVLPEESRVNFADERDYIDEFRSWPNIRMRYVTAAGRGPFDRLNELSRFTVFPMRPGNAFQREEIEAVAIAEGARTLLWGIGGELGPTAWGKRYYVELAVKMRWSALFSELRRLRAVGGVRRPIRMLGAEFLTTLFPARGITSMMLFSRDFLRQYNVASPMVNHWPYHRQFLATQLRHWLRRHAVRGHATWLIPPAFPLLDKRVLEFCLALPGSFYVRDGYRRSLIRGALDGILPKRIQLRTTKSPFSPDYPSRFDAQRGIAQEFVAAIGPNDPVRSIVDVEKLGNLLRPNNLKADSPLAASEVPLTCYLISFLRQFSEFRS